jgi:MFS family permease
MIFGHFADRLGRKRVAVASVIGFGTITLIITCLPGYASRGIGAVALLIVLRFVGGVFLGGEYSSAMPLAMEYSPTCRRGLFGGVIVSGYPLAYCLVAIITYVLLKVFPQSAYVQWGWRIPFVIGAVLAFVFVLWFARSVTESKLWESGPKQQRPLEELLRRNNLGDLGQVFVLMTGVWLMLNMMSAVLPRLLKTELKLTSSTITALLIIVYAILIGARTSVAVR